MALNSDTRARPHRGILIYMGKRLRSPLNRLLAAQSLISNRPFPEPAEIPGIEELVASWPAIRCELDWLLQARADIPSLGGISPDHRRIAPNGKWKSFFLQGHGYAIENNRACCPETAAAIDRVPDVVVAFFSIFEPGTHVPPHRGVSKAMVNVHLGLIVPDGPERCGIRVEQETRGWAEGELLVLDETYRHEAWNLTAEPRVVLFLQVRRPMRRWGWMVGDAFLWLMRRTTYVQEARAAIGAVRIHRSGSRKRQHQHA